MFLFLIFFFRKTVGLHNKFMPIHLKRTFIVLSKEYSPLCLNILLQIDYIFCCVYYTLHIITEASRRGYWKICYIVGSTIKGYLWMQTQKIQEMPGKLKNEKKNNNSKGKKRTQHERTHMRKSFNIIHFYCFIQVE